MGFDLWNTLGVSPQAGILAAVGGLVVAGLFGVHVFWRNRSESGRLKGLSLDE